MGPNSAGEFEFNDGANFPGDNGSGNQEGIGINHNGSGGNITRLDGGVEFISSKVFNKLSQQTAGPGPGGKTKFWWSVWTSNGH
jgi:hypothetical protein